MHAHLIEKSGKKRKSVDLLRLFERAFENGQFGCDRRAALLAWQRYVARVNGELQ